VETLVDAPKQEERKFNLHLISFEAKEGEIENKLVQQLNIELLQGQMRLRVKVVMPCCNGLPLCGLPSQHTPGEDRQAALRGCKGLAGTKLGLDENLTPTQQVRKSEI
jgi:hypothetical protein